MKNLKKLSLISLTTLCVLGTSVAAKEPKIQVAVNDKFNTFTQHWSRELGDTNFAWDIIKQDGEFLVCGVMASEKHSRMVQHNRTILRKSFIKVDGKKVMRGLPFFTVLKPGSDVSKGTAGCAVMPVTLGPKSKVSIGIDRFKVRL